MVFYFVMKQLEPGSLLQHFVDGDDEFRNSRLKLIPSVPKVRSRSALAAPLAQNLLRRALSASPPVQGSWIVRQSVGSTPCLLGKAVDCTYIRGSTYLEVGNPCSFQTLPCPARRLLLRGGGPGLMGTS